MVAAAVVDTMVQHNTRWYLDGESVSSFDVKMLVTILMDINVDDVLYRIGYCGVQWVRGFYINLMMENEGRLVQRPRDHSNGTY